MNDRNLRWEIRVRHGPATMTTSTKDRDEAAAYYARELAGLDPGNRAELVMIDETVIDSTGPGPVIDPWEAIQLPFLKPEDYARLAAEGRREDED